MPDTTHLKEEGFILTDRIRVGVCALEQHSALAGTCVSSILSVAWKMQVQMGNCKAVLETHFPQTGPISQ